MRSPLNLEEKSFDLSEWVAVCGDNLDMVRFKVPGKEEMIMLPFFGHVFVGFETVEDSRWFEFACSDLSDFRAPAFKCPAHWTLAKILGTLKVFGSIGDAKRNGWDRLSEQGWEDHKVRVAKRPGVLTVVTPTDLIKIPGRWEECERD